MNIWVLLFGDVRCVVLLVGCFDCGLVDVRFVCILRWVVEVKG